MHVYLNVCLDNDRVPFYADAAIYYNGNECFAWVNTKGCIYSPEAGDPEGTCVECVASSFSNSSITAMDAIADASARPRPAFLTAELRTQVLYMHALQYMCYSVLVAVQPIMSQLYPAERVCRLLCWFAGIPYCRTASPQQLRPGRPAMICPLEARNLFRLAAASLHSFWVRVGPACNSSDRQHPSESGCRMQVLALWP